MTNLILSRLFLASVGPMIGYALDLMLTPKENKLKRWMRIVIWMLLYELLGSLKFYFQHSSGSTFLNFAFFVLQVLVASFLYSDKLWKRVFAYLCIYLAVCCGECAYFLIPSVYTEGGLSLDYSQPDMMVGCFFGAVLSHFFTAVVIVFWRKFQSKRTPRHLWAYLLLPICFNVPAIQHTINTIENNGTIRWTSTISILASGVITILLMVFLFNQAEHEGVEEELIQIRYQSDLEHQHYQEIENRREEIAKIRHDYNNFLTSVLGLLEMSRREEAEKALQELLQRVRDTREYPYCGIPIVNALLAEKCRHCLDQNILLKIDLLIPDDSGIASIDLCSVFGNMLDNAIRACGHLKEETEPVIKLTAGVQGGYLIIKCTNPAVKPRSVRPEGTGYGMKILHDIAGRYHGNFTADFENGIFTACAVLTRQGT